MRQAHTLVGSQVRELSDLQSMEQRVKQLESLVLEMRLEIEELRSNVKPDNQKRLEKMMAYQSRFDQMFGLRDSA